jgi:hypothetical protein
MWSGFPLRSRADIPTSGGLDSKPPRDPHRDTYYQTPPRVEFDNYKASYFLM